MRGTHAGSRTDVFAFDKYLKLKGNR